MGETGNSLSKGKFAAVTLLIWCLFLLIAAPQWLLLCLYGKDFLVYTLSCFFVGFLLLTCIHLCEPLKYSRPWNLIFIIVCYELLTLGVSTFLSYWNLVYTIIVMGVGLLFAIVALFIAVLLILTMYPNPSKVAVVGCMGFALVFCIRSIDILQHWFLLRDIEVAVFLASTIIVMVAHVLISNDNFELLKLDDAVLVALVLYIYYLLFLVGGRIATYCIMANEHYYADEGKGTTVTLRSLLNDYLFKYV